MAMESILTLCALIHFYWCLFEVFCQFNLAYFVPLIPYALLIKIFSIMDVKRNKTKDAFVQTNFEEISQMKDAETSTDAFTCGDTEAVVLNPLQQTTNPFLDASLNLTSETLAGIFAREDTEAVLSNTLQHSTNPFLDASLDLTAETLAGIFACGDTDAVVWITPTNLHHSSNTFLDGFFDLSAVKETNPVEQGSVPLLLYQGENEHRPEIDSASFEVDEPELIEIFQLSKNSFSLLDNPCPQDFTNNPFLATNPFEWKSNNPFKSSFD